MTKPSNKWMHRVEDIERQLNTYWVPEYREVVAHALEAADKAATERAAQIGYATCAATRHVTLGREVEKNILAGDLDAAIRKGEQ